MRRHLTAVHRSLRIWPYLDCLAGTPAIFLGAGKYMCGVAYAVFLESPFPPIPVGAVVGTTVFYGATGFILAKNLGAAKRVGTDAEDNLVSRVGLRLFPSACRLTHASSNTCRSNSRSRSANATKKVVHVLLGIHFIEFVPLRMGIFYRSGSGIRVESGSRLYVSTWRTWSSRRMLLREAKRGERSSARIVGRLAGSKSSMERNARFGSGPRLSRRALARAMDGWLPFSSEYAARCVA